MAASLTFPPPAHVAQSAGLPPAYDSDLFTESPTSPVPMINDDLPTYGAERRTRPERCFWLGFIFFPFWALGSFLYLLPSDPLVAARCKSASKTSLVTSQRLSIHSHEEGLAELSVSDEMRNFWRGEERKWAYLCLQFFAVALILITLAVFCVLYFFVLKR